MNVSALRSRWCELHRGLTVRWRSAHRSAVASTTGGANANKKSVWQRGKPPREAGGGNDSAEHLISKRSQCELPNPSLNRTAPGVPASAG